MAAILLEKKAVMILLTLCDELLTGIPSIIMAIRTEDAEVQAKKDAIIAKMMAEPDLTDPMAPE